MRLTLVLLTFAALFGLVACSGQGSGESATTSAEITAAGTFTGTVKETVNAGGYTYARLENGGKSVWAAARETELPVGTKVTVSTAMPMQNWHSESLDRTWDTVYFTTSFDAPGSTAPSGDPHAGMGAPNMGDPHGAVGSTPAQVAPGTIEKAAGGVTIADLWTNKSTHSGSKVTVRGKVVKFNGGIMGRNWIHLQDGSGDASSGTNDLTVTTDAVCKVGDTVVVTGTVAVDKDFGSGYRYGLLVEEAKVEVEAEMAGTH